MRNLQSSVNINEHGGNHAKIRKQKVLSEIETAEYISMSRSFLRQSRTEGRRENRTPAPPFIKIG